MGTFAKGKRSLAISDRSGMAFPYTEMVREWNGSLVHTSEYEAKQPQLEPKPVGSDPQALFNPRPQPASKTSLILLGSNPFTTVISGGTTYVNVFSENHQRSAGDVVRFRGAPIVTAAGPGGSDPADNRNMQQFATIPTFDNVSDLNNVNGLFPKRIKLAFDAGCGLGLNKACGSLPTGFGFNCGCFASNSEV